MNCYDGIALTVIPRMYFESYKVIYDVLELQQEHQAKIQQIQEKHNAEIEQYQAKYKELLEQLEKKKDTKTTKPKQTKIKSE